MRTHGGKYFRIALNGIMILLTIPVLLGLGVNRARADFAEPPVQIRWFVGLGAGTDPENVAVEQQVVDDFNAAHPGIELILEVVDFSSADATLASQIAAGTGPDIVGPVGWGGGDYFHGQWLDLAPLIASSGFDAGIFNPALMDQFQTEDEGMVGLPITAYPSALYYNPALFDAAGLNYPPAHYGDAYEMPDHSLADWSWDTLAQVAKRLTLDSGGLNSTQGGFDGADIVQYGFSFGFQNYPNYWGSYWQGNSLLAGTPGAYAGAVPPAWAEAFQWNYDGIWGGQPYIASLEVESSAEFNYGDTFDSGRIGMLINPSWYMCCMETLIGGGGTFQFGAMPAYNGQVGGRVDSDGFRILKDSQHPVEAFTVLRYLVDDAAPDLSALYGGPPARTADQVDYFAGKAALFPFVTGDSWNVLLDGYNHADVPSADGHMPNRDLAWNRINSFGNLLRDTPGLDLESEEAALEADLTVLFNRFGKLAPADGSEHQPAGLVMSWDAMDISADYQFCLDDSGNGVCDWGWFTVGSSTSLEVDGLLPNTTYYWEVRAVTAVGITEYNDGKWWGFTTAPPAPGAFGKTAPADASYPGSHPILSWGASSGATGYEYCVDTTNNGGCDSSWIPTLAETGAALSGLALDTTYYWQARAVGDGIDTYADDGAWWSFTTPLQSFADVPVSYWAWPYIERLYAAGITGGCGTSPLIFCPAGSVTRAQMAVFLERGMNGPAYAPLAATGTVFGDVPISHWAAAWIEQLSADGITGGCGGGNYCPDQTVTRAEMAIFLLRAEHGSAYAPPAATGTVFGDVSISHWAGAWIEQLDAEGITGGCGGGNFCPNRPVTRAEMAVFLVRAFGLP